MSTLDAAYQSVILAGATQLSLDNFLEQAEFVNTKIEALVRVDQLEKIVRLNQSSIIRMSVVLFNFMVNKINASI
jgi:adenine/guanine phosphoribosyltransferase-like PRPP-binding protein